MLPYLKKKERDGHFEGNMYNRVKHVLFSKYCSSCPIALKSDLIHGSLLLT